MDENTITIQLPEEMLLINITDIVGTAEVATLLNCPKQQIHALRKRSDFPAPIVNLSATPLWNAQHIKEFGANWKRRRTQM
jgi:hypothetical protein